MAAVERKSLFRRSGHRGNGSDKVASDGSAAKVQAASAGSSGFYLSPFILHHAFYAGRKGIASFTLALREVAIPPSVLPAGTPFEHRYGRLVTNLLLYIRSHIPPLPIPISLRPADIHHRRYRSIRNHFLCHCSPGRHARPFKKWSGFVSWS